MISIPNNLEDAVVMTPEVKGWYCTGLQAIKKEHKRNRLIVARKGILINGSLDIDKATERLRRNENRWDYVIESQRELHFVEVHPADSGHAQKEVLEKLQWLKKWLRENAVHIDELPFPKRFHWVASGKIDLRGMPFSKIAPTSKQRIRAGLILKPVSCLQI